MPITSLKARLPLVLASLVEAGLVLFARRFAVQPATLDDQAPIEMLRLAESPEQFTAVVRTARQMVSFQT